MLIKSICNSHIKLLISLLLISFSWSAELNTDINSNECQSPRITRDPIFSHDNQAEKKIKSKSPSRTLEKRPTVIFSKSEGAPRSLSLTREQKTFSGDLIVTKPYYSQSSPPSTDGSSRNNTTNPIRKTTTYPTAFSQNFPSNHAHTQTINVDHNKTNQKSPCKLETRPSRLITDRRTSDDTNSLSPQRSSSSLSQYSSEPNSSSSSSEDLSENYHSNSEEDPPQNEFEFKIPRSLNSGISLNFNIAPSKKPTSLKISFLLYDENPKTSDQANINAVTSSSETK